MVKPIPDRWLDYRPIGERIAGTRFIAFKVPLLENINQSVGDERLRLAPQSLLKSVPNLGLIVDLTNTNRYYNPQAFRDQNVEHQKLMIPGHETPPTILAQRFCEYVSNFLEANADNDKLIGVHCTHGVNRTGYLICYFMITKMNMSPKLAIQIFADARGHKIERKNYTQSLEHLTSALDLPRESSQRQRELRRRQEISLSRKCNESSDNWRDHKSDQNDWHQQQQQQRRLQWRDSSRYRSEEDGWQRPQPQRWRQEARSAGGEGRFHQDQRSWQPRQYSRDREDEDQSYRGRSSSSSGYYNNSYGNRGNNYNDDGNSRGTNYSRCNNYSSGNSYNNRQETRTKWNRFQSP